MDILDIFNGAVSDLPQGEYSAGLNAIARHIEAAIRHYQRDTKDDPDCYTDSVYRTNQAFEGSLKEAYRVLAERDPSRLTPNEIEKYLEDNNSLRPRVLTQLTRYRQDYRNPSTHDYKLDFDESEALLAIVSVAAFSKLLVSQIRDKLAYQAGKQNAKPILIDPKIASDELHFKIAQLVAGYCNDYDISSISKSELISQMMGALSKYGFDVDDDWDGETWWDIVAAFKEIKFSIDINFGDARFSTSRLIPIYYVSSGIEEDNLDGGIIITRMRKGGNYSMFKASRSMFKPIWLVTNQTKKEIETRLGSSWKIET